MSVCEINGPMTDEERDLEYVRSIIDEAGNIRPRNFHELARLSSKGLIKVYVQPSPRALQKLRSLGA